MDLRNLQAAGAFVPAALVPRVVDVKRPVIKPETEWADPAWPEPTGEFVDDKLPVWIRKRSSANFVEMANATDADRAHVAILRCVFNEDGTPAFTDLEQVKRIDDWLFVPLFLAVNEVNNYRGKNSLPKTSSGTNSPSSSAARSRKRRTGSANRSSSTGGRTGPSAAP
jgi:hypothetical protein